MNHLCECSRCGRMTWATVMIYDGRGVLLRVLCLTCIRTLEKP